MRYALLVARVAGEPHFKVLAEPAAPSAITAEFKRLVITPGNLAELHLIISDQGLTKRKKFQPDQPALEQPASASSAPTSPDPGISDLDLSGPTINPTAETLAEADPSPLKLTQKPKLKP